MIPKFNDINWEKFDSIKKGEGFFVSEDGTYVRLFDEKPYATLKKMMYTVEIENGKTYTLTVPYKIKSIKHKSMLYGLITLYDNEDKQIRRLYLNYGKNDELKIVFKAKDEVKVRIEFGLKAYGDVCFYNPSLEVCGEIKKKNIKIATTYLKVGKQCPYEDNLKRIDKSIDEAAKMGADLVCFAETMNDRGTNLSWAEKFETIDGTFCTMMRKKAKEKGMFLFFSFHELDEYGARRNTAVLVDRQGEIVGKHCKSNLTIGEFEGGMVAGDKYEVFDTEIGKIGMLICWDAYFPETARAMALRDADIILISTAGNPTHRHFARAKENGVYVIVSCCGSKDSGVEPSKIISPKGEVLAEAGQEGEIAFAEIDLYDDLNRNIYWLSVGAAWADPNNIYMNDIRPDLYDKIVPDGKYDL